MNSDSLVLSHNVFRLLGKNVVSDAGLVVIGDSLEKSVCVYNILFLVRYLACANRANRGV